MGAPGRRETLQVAALCGAWYALSAASNVVGKLVLSRLPLPLTVSMVQLFATAALSAPALWACGVPRARAAPPGPPAAPAVTWRALLLLAAAKFLTTACSQVSIWRVPVSYAHTVKATTPLWTAGLARALLGERQPARVVWALVVIACGVGVASATELQFEALGLAAALAAAALLSLQHIYSKRALRDPRVHPLRLLQTLSALALAMFLPLWAALEGPALAGAVAGAGAGAGAGVLPLLAADGALAWAQAVCAFLVLSRVSPLAYAVASAAKRVAVVGASLLVLRNPAPPLNLAGMALAALGVLAYNRAKLRAPPAPPAPPAPSRRPLLPV